MPSSTVIAGTGPGGVPFAWIDDASLLPAGAGALMVSAVGWRGADASEWDAPVMGATVGLTSRLQFTASVPHVVGNEANGVVGGLGTTFLTGKIGVIERADIKVAAAPTVEVLGTGVLQYLASGESRVQWGVPVSIELDRGSARAFASAGYFTRGIRFVGGGVGLAASPRVSLSGSFSHAWLSEAAFAAAGGTDAVRNELTGTMSFSATSHFGLFGSLGHTVATTDANGAGLTLGLGVWVLGNPARQQ